MSIAMWSLADGDQRRREHPDTWQMPSVEERRSLAIGSVVKLAFEKSGGGGERMWVVITDADYPQFAGTLENTPVDIPGLAHGDVIRFESRNIIDLEGEA
jgi:hypothetical protein